MVQVCCCKHENPEVVAWSLDAAGRGTVLMSGIFLGSGMLRAAMKQAEIDGGCRDAGAPDDCEPAKVYGMQATSILGMIAVVAGLVNAFFMPYFGALVDFTDKRKQVGEWTGYVIIAVNLAQMIVSTETWFICALLQVLQLLAYIAHSTCVFAYLPETTEDHETELPKITASTWGWMLGSQFLYMVGTTIVAVGMGLTTIGTAKAGQAVTAVVCAILWYYAWADKKSEKAFPGFGKRRANSTLKEGETLWVAGWRKIFTTVGEVYRKYPQSGRFWFAYIFWEAASGAFVTIGVTYLSVELEMSGAMIGLNILTLLGCGVVGTKLSTCLTTAFGSCKRSLIAALVYFAFVSALAANILIGKESQMLSFPVAVLWGLAFGWVYPSQRVLYSMLLPGGQEVEYMGFMNFCSNLLAWAPNLLFVMLNESTGQLNYGLYILSAFHLIGAALASRIDVEKARADVAPSLTKRQHGGEAGVAVAIGGTEIAV